MKIPYAVCRMPHTVYHKNEQNNISFPSKTVSNSVMNHLEQALSRLFVASFENPLKSDTISSN